MKISELSKIINGIKQEKGDLEVYMSSDAEGNSFGTIEYSKATGGSFYFDNKKMVLFPCQEFTDLDLN